MDPTTKAIRTRRWAHRIAALLLFLAGFTAAYWAALLGWLTATPTPPPQWLAQSACFLTPLCWLLALITLSLTPRLPTPQGPRCNKCGYDLSGLAPSAPCPECGAA